MSDNLPKIKNEGILEKIKNVFYKLFVGKKSQTESVKTEVNNHEKDSIRSDKTDLLSNLQNQIENEVVSDNELLITLQRKIKNNEIQISELTDEELDGLIELYETQIANKEKNLQSNNAEN